MKYHPLRTETIVLHGTWRLFSHDEERKWTLVILIIQVYGCSTDQLGNILFNLFNHRWYHFFILPITDVQPSLSLVNSDLAVRSCKCWAQWRYGSKCSEWSSFNDWCWKQFPPCSAFDTIDHALLFKRLHNEIFVQGTVLEWFSSYLLCRFQQVLVGQSYSAETPLLCGVPQRSVLSPILFSLYPRQLAELIQKHSIDYHLFADDSELYSCLLVEWESALQVICSVESCCNEIGKWMSANKLKLNEKNMDTHTNTHTHIYCSSLSETGIVIDQETWATWKLVGLSHFALSLAWRASSLPRVNLSPEYIICVDNNFLNNLSLS